jgi:hypothetical protein
MSEAIIVDSMRYKIKEESYSRSEMLSFSLAHGDQFCIIIFFRKEKFDIFARRKRASLQKITGLLTRNIY